MLFQDITGGDVLADLGCSAEPTGRPSAYGPRKCGWESRQRHAQQEQSGSGHRASVGMQGDTTMDVSFIGKPHEWDPRRVYSQTGADWQQRVDFDRLRKDRVQRLPAPKRGRGFGRLG